MSDALTPEKVVEMKHAMAGLAEIYWTYFKELREQGFSRKEALTIVIEYQAAINKATPSP